MTQAATSATTVSFFDKFFAADKATVDASKKPFIQKRLQRAYASAIDGIDVEILRLESRVDGLRRNFEDPCLNEIVDTVSEIADQKRNRAILAAEYEVMFGAKIGA